MKPTRRALLLFGLGLPVALLPVMLTPQLWALWLASTVICVAALAIDLLAAPGPAALQLAVEVPEALYIGDRDPLKLRLQSPRSVAVELLGELGERLHPVAAERLSLQADEALEHAIDLVPVRRGMARVEAIWMRWEGPLGLMRRTRRHALEAELPVLPDIRAVRAAALRLQQRNDFVSGLKTQHFVGDGSEFDALREYRAGLDPRAIDWKASARHHKLITRDFRAERNHQLILAFDTGYLMGEPLAGVPKLDRAINAGLLLAFYSLRAGDRVGLFGFDQKVRLQVDPRAGIRSMQLLQRKAAELDYSTEETNFTLGLTQLATRLRRRSMVVVLTDFVDTTTAELMVENLQRLVRRHVVVFVSLRDPTLDGVARAEPDRLDTLHRATAAFELLKEREEVIQRLRRAGVFCIDAPPERVSAELINRYLDIHRRELV